MILSAFIAVIAAGCLALGFYLGRRLAAAPIKRLIEVRRNSYLLGQLIKDDHTRKLVAEAYHDPEEAYREMDSYHWDAVNMIPSPFVGYLPEPFASERFKTNSQQFRAKSEISTPKPVNSIRIFLVGASTAFGSGAPDQDRTITGYLEQILNGRSSEGRETKYELFCAAAPAWCSAHERIAIENMVSELSPDLVVSLSGNNEAHWGWNFKNPMWFRSYAESYFWKVLKEAYNIAGERFPDDPITDEKKPMTPERIAAILAKNTALSLSALKKAGAPFVFALQPTIAITSKTPSPREEQVLAQWHPEQIKYYKEVYSHIRENLRALVLDSDSFHFLDLSAIFDDRRNESIFLDSYHFGDKGNEIIAETLAPEIVKALNRRSR